MRNRRTDKPKSRFQQYAEAVASYDGESIDGMFLAAGFDVTKDLQHSNWSGMNFRGSDLFGFDLSGCDLSKCNFDNAKIVGATFDDDVLKSGLLDNAIGFRKYKKPVKDRAHFARVFLRCQTVDQASSFILNHGDQVVVVDAEHVNSFIKLHSDFNKAISLLRLFDENGIQPNVETFDWLGHCAELSPKKDDPSQRVEQVVELSKKWQIRPSGKLYARLVGTASDFNEAKKRAKEMAQNGIALDQQTYARLIKRSPDFETAIAEFREMRYYRKLEPTAEIYEAMIFAAPDLNGALTNLTAMEKRNFTVTTAAYNAIMSKIYQPGFRNTDDVRFLKKGEYYYRQIVRSGSEPDGDTFAELMRLCPNFKSVLKVLDLNKKSKVWIGNRALNFAAYRVRNLGSAFALRDKLPRQSMLPTTFFEQIFDNLAPNYDADVLLEWAFSNKSNAHRPKEGAWGVAIRKYHKSKKNRLPQALRIALAFPHLPESQELFCDHPDHSYDYLFQEFESGKEPHHAANAIAHLLVKTGKLDEAKNWWERSLQTGLNTTARETNIMIYIEELEN